MATAGDKDPFYSSLNKILLVAAASAFGGLGIRYGTDPLKEEIAAVRKELTKMYEDHDRRISNLETLYLPRTE